MRGSWKPVPACRGGISEKVSQGDVWKRDTTAAAPHQPAYWCTRAGLPRDQIDRQNHRFMIYGKGGPYGTKSKHRIVPLTDRVRPLIDGHFAIHDTIGMTPRTIQRILKRVANKAGINRPVSPHVLRHTFAVAAVQKGISLPALQRLLGHDRLTTTKIYLNLSPEDVMREFQEKW